MIRRALALVLLTIFLSGCMSYLMRSSRDEWPEIGQEFAKSLRWSGADLAATFFADSARTDFLTAYRDVGAELRVTSVQHDAVGAIVDKKTQGILTIEYYRAPSVSVKRASIPLEWSCVEVDKYLPCCWQITTVVSRLP